MADVTAEAFEKLLEIDQLAKQYLAMKAGVKVDEFQAELWQRMGKTKFVEPITETILGDAIGDGQTLGFKTWKGTEIWLQQPLNETLVVGSESVHGKRNADILVVRFNRNVAGTVTDVHLSGMDNHSLGPSDANASSSHRAHFNRKVRVMGAWELRFRERFPGANVTWTLNEHDSFFWRSKLNEISLIELEQDAAKLLAADKDLVGTLERDLERTAERLRREPLSLLESMAPEAVAPIAEGLLRVAGTSATLAGIAWKGKELTDIEMKLYKSPTLHSLMVAIKNDDGRQVENFRRLLKEWTRPDVIPIVEDFTKVGFGTIIGLDLWEKFVDFLIDQWKKAAAEARQKLQDQAK